MTKIKLIHTILAASLALSFTACGDDGSEESSTNATDPTNTTPPATDPSMGTTMEDPTTTPDPTTTNNPSVGTDPDTTDPTNDPTTGGGDSFMFAEDPYDAYQQIDRHGAVEAGTAGIKAASGLGLNGEDIAIRDDYNASNPLEDSMDAWFGEIAMSVTFFHDNLDDDLTGLGLTPCDVPTAAAQAGPVIIPDTIKYDPGSPTGYPNGRALTDQVVDITLAAVLLDLGVHPLTTFADIAVNPVANDVPFGSEFPFLAPPHL